MSPVLQVTKIDAYDIMTLLGDIGGTSGFFVSVLAPIVAWIIGDRFVYVLLKSLYMQNREGSVPPDEFDQVDGKNLTPAEQKKLRESRWLHATVPYEESTMN